MFYFSATKHLTSKRLWDVLIGIHSSAFPLPSCDEYWACMGFLMVVVNYSTWVLFYESSTNEIVNTDNNRSCTEMWVLIQLGGAWIMFSDTSFYKNSIGCTFIRVSWSTNMIRLVWPERSHNTASCLWSFYCKMVPHSVYNPSVLKVIRE